jgi:erythromycin esterase-like protein
MFARPAIGQQSSDRVIDAVVHDACGKRVVFLGEPPMHGFARTLEIKTEIAQRLVKSCGFNAFFIESGAYDFLNIRTKLAARQPLTQTAIAAAIGGLWAVREVEPLLPLLLDGAQRGALVLGGLDDQLGRGTYAQLEMPADLVASLAGDDKPRCLAVLQRHMLYQYTNDAPYGAEDKARILECVDKIAVSLRPRPASPARDDAMAMLDNLRRMFARDFRAAPAAGGQDFNDRDASMYENFKWWQSRLPTGSKMIVWTATNHAAKNLAGVAGLSNLVSLGSQIRRAFNGQAFVLGFSALSGSYALGRQPPRTLIAAPENSLEAKAFQGGDADTRYVDAKTLSQLGSIAARPLGADFKTARWSEVVDALVVLRQEHPPSTRSSP